MHDKPLEMVDRSFETMSPVVFIDITCPEWVVIQMAASFTAGCQGLTSLIDVETLIHLEIECCNQTLVLYTQTRSKRGP